MVSSMFFYQNHNLILKYVFRKKQQKQFLLINGPTDAIIFRFHPYMVEQSCSLGSSEQVSLICCLYEKQSVKSYRARRILRRVAF